VAKGWDEGALWLAGLQCVEALDQARRSLQQLPPATLRKVSAFDWKTPFGWIRIRGTGDDDIDASDALLIVDLGGNNHWHGPVGASSPTRLIGLALALSGHNVFEGGDVVQGVGIAGIGVLLDAGGGGDRYEAGNYAQGTGLLGFGALINLGGNNVYRASRIAQGSSPFVGVGLLADAEGYDRYSILNAGQGYGGPGGVGILANRMGNNTYYAEPDMRKGWPGYGEADEGSSSQAQGFGAGSFAGPASQGQFWAGGIGALINIGGNNSYVAGSWSQGMGYFYGMGILYSGNGKNRYKGGILSQAAAAHYGIGGLIDDGGDNIHVDSGQMALAHDVSIALFLANGGNNRYTAPSFALSRDRSPLALFVNVGGNNVYECKGNPLRGVIKDRTPGFARYDPAFASNPDGTGPLIDTNDVAAAFPYTSSGSVKNGLGASGRLQPYFAYLYSYSLFLDVGGKNTYLDCGSAADGSVWGDRPGSDNWRAHNVGVGMDVDVPSGTIDWRPLPTWDR
jgi:hypothetical protein